MCRPPHRSSCTCIPFLHVLQPRLRPGVHLLQSRRDLSCPVYNSLQTQACVRVRRARTHKRRHVIARPPELCACVSLSPRLSMLEHMYARLREYERAHTNNRIHMCTHMCTQTHTGMRALPIWRTCEVRFRDMCVRLSPCLSQRAHVNAFDITCAQTHTQTTGCIHARIRGQRHECMRAHTSSTHAFVPPGSAGPTQLCTIVLHGTRVTMHWRAANGDPYTAVRVGLNARSSTIVHNHDQLTRASVLHARGR